MLVGLFGRRFVFFFFFFFFWLIWKARKWPSHDEYVYLHGSERCGVYDSVTE